MGDGLKYETTKFFPINPPQICRDPEEKFTSSEVSTFSILTFLFSLNQPMKQFKPTKLDWPAKQRDQCNKRRKTIDLLFKFQTF